MTALKKKQRRIRRNMKPIITLLVVSLGIILRFLFYMIFYMLGRIFLEYQDLLQYALITNCQYLVHLVNPIAYGLYFTEVCKPMMKCLRRVMKIDRFNSDNYSTATKNMTITSLYYDIRYTLFYFEM